MNKFIKNQINLLKPSATLALNEESDRLKKSGKKIYKFGFGQSPFPVPNEVRNELINNAHQNKYLPMQGLPELRNSIAKYITNIKKKFCRLSQTLSCYFKWFCMSFFSPLNPKFNQKLNFSWRLLFSSS